MPECDCNDPNCRDCRRRKVYGGGWVMPYGVNLNQDQFPGEQPAPVDTGEGAPVGDGGGGGATV